MQLPVKDAYNYIVMVLSDHLGLLSPSAKIAVQAQTEACLKIIVRELEINKDEVVE